MELSEYHDQLRDDQGRYRTASLFEDVYNTNANEKYTPIFTMKAHDHRDCVSFKRVYLECSDPTGYKAAQVLLGEWEHWLKLLKAPWFRSALEVWNEELEIKLKSQAIQKVAELAQSDTSQAFNASKYLADKGWEPKRGRPTKAEKEAEIKRSTKIDKAVSEDLERIGLTLVK